MASTFSGVTDVGENHTTKDKAFSLTTASRPVGWRQLKF
jgi:hypothetical protein